MTLGALAPGVAGGAARAFSRARSISALALGTSVGALALKLVGLVEQKNFGFVSLMLPIWLGATLALSLQLGSRNR